MCVQWPHEQREETRNGDHEGSHMAEHFMQPTCLVQLVCMCLVQFQLRSVFHKTNLFTRVIVQYMLAPGAGSIDGVAFAFAFGAGGADTSHKEPAFKGVCLVASARKNRAQACELTLSMRISCFQA